MSKFTVLFVGIQSFHVGNSIYISDVSRTGNVGILALLTILAQNLNIGAPKEGYQPFQMFAYFFAYCKINYQSRGDVIEAPALAHAPAKKAKFEHSFQKKWALLAKTDNRIKCQIYMLQVHQQRQNFHKWM